MNPRTSKPNFIISIVLLVMISFSVMAQNETPTSEPMGSMSGMSGMGGMEMVTDYSVDDLAPLVRGIYEGDDVLFLHTEVSDESIAEILTEMMGPEVIVVPSLAEIPQELLGNVYVFTNGIVDGGPLGFQSDIFDSVPGDEGYTPLRQINLVTWNEDSDPQQLNSVNELFDAEDAGDLTIEASGIVVNMPILVWADETR